MSIEVTMAAGYAISLVAQPMKKMKSSESGRSGGYTIQGLLNPVNLVHAREEIQKRSPTLSLATLNLLVDLEIQASIEDLGVDKPPISLYPPQNKKQSVNNKKAE